MLSGGLLFVCECQLLPVVQGRKGKIILALDRRLFRKKGLFCAGIGNMAGFWAVFLGK
jgi:hypothetical protein